MGHLERTEQKISLRNDGCGMFSFFFKLPKSAWYFFTDVKVEFATRKESFINIFSDLIVKSLRNGCGMFSFFLASLKCLVLFTDVKGEFAIRKESFINVISNCFYLLF